MPTPAFKKVSDLVYARLADPQIGFNPNYLAIQPAYGAEDAVINFDPTSFTFFFGRISPELLKATSPGRFPFCTLDIASAVQMPVGQRLIMGSFSGHVTMSIEVWFSWGKSSVTDFMKTPQCIGDALINTFNNINKSPWAPGLVYGGDISIQVGPVRSGGLHWLRNVLATLSFEVYV